MSGTTSIKCFLLGLAIYCHVGFSQSINKGINITIPLNKTRTGLDKQLYETFVYLNQSSSLQVNFVEANKNLSFIVFQVHSHIHNVTLYRNLGSDEIYGTNLGHYSQVGKKLDTFYVENNNDLELKLLITVQGYSVNDPVPGGCNMEFPTPIAPYMETSYNRHYITVDFAPAGVDVNCLEVNSIFYLFYMVYLPEGDLGADTYFDVLRNMTTIGNIRRIGSFVAKGAWNNRRMFSSYPGTGAIYVAVAKHYAVPYYSVYVPTHSYGCSLTADGDCELLEDVLTEVLCATLFFIGIFICYFGHRFFKTQTFFIGFLSGVVVTYILLSLIVTLDASALVLACAISGICVGAIRVVCWWLYGLPIYSIILTSADIGFLTSCIVYYIVPESGSERMIGEPAYMSFLRQDINFWPIFVLIALLVTLLLISVSFIANLVCCAVIGAYATIYPIDFYMGSNLKYILINVIRRATVKGFSKAVVMPPFQWKDILLALLWLALSASGFVYQYFQNKGRPPFPPPPRSVRAVPELPASVAGPSGYGYRTLNQEISNSNSESVPRSRARTITNFFKRRNVSERTPLLA